MIEKAFHEAGQANLILETLTSDGKWKTDNFHDSFVFHIGCVHPSVWCHNFRWRADVYSSMVKILFLKKVSKRKSQKVKSEHCQ